MKRVNDRDKATIFMVAFVVVLAIIFTVATAYRANAARQWAQGFPKPADVACEDLNAYLFPEGVVPQELVPVFGNDADTEWSESWTGASWAPNGYICIREIGPELVPAEEPPSDGDEGGGGPPDPSGREYLYSGGSLVNGVLGGGSGYTYVSSSFSICTTWTAARVTSANGLVSVDSWSDGNYVYVYNSGDLTTISVYVTCA